jgi:hypothetical protein
MVITLIPVSEAIGSRTVECASRHLPGRSVSCVDGQSPRRKVKKVFRGRRDHVITMYDPNTIVFFFTGGLACFRGSLF